MTVPAAPTATARPLVVATAVLLVLLLAGTGAGVLISQAVRTTSGSTAVLVPLADRLTVYGDNGDVALTPSPDGDVHVRTVVRHGVGEPELVQESTPLGVDLSFRCNDLFGASCGVDYTIQVPPSFTVRVENGSDVTARGLTGPLTIVTGGDVDLLDVSGPLDLHSMYGDVHAARVRSASITAVGSADVRVAMIAPPGSARLSSTGGDVDVVVPEGQAYQVFAGTVLGERVVRVPSDPTSSRVITADAEWGDVSIRPGPPG